MGVTKILAVARNPELLEEVRKLAPSRILVHSVQDGPIEPWAYHVTDGDGVDLVIDCLGPGPPGSAMIDAMRSLRRSVRIVNVGAVADIMPLDVPTLMVRKDRQVDRLGKVWTVRVNPNGTTIL